MSKGPWRTNKGKPQGSTGIGSSGGSGQRPGGRGHIGFGPRGIQMQGDKPRDFKKTLKKFVRYIGKFKTKVLVVMIFAVASTAFAIVGPKIIGRATTKLFEGVMGNISGTGSGIDFKYIGSIILISLGLYVASAIFSYMQGWIMSGVSMKVTYRFRRDISKKINRMPFKYFDNTNQGEVLSRVTNDVDAINQTLNQSLTQIITSIATVIGILAMMLTISRIMTLIAILIVPLSLIMILAVVRRSQKYFKQQQDYLGHVNGHVEEMFGGHNVMRAFNGEKRSIKKFNGFNNILYGAAWKSQFLSGMMMPIAFFVGNLGYVAVSVLGGWLAVQGKMSVGDILAFILYVRTFIQPISQMANISNILQQTAASAERVFEFLEEEEESPDTTNPVVPGRISGNVRFDDVHFGYKPGQTIIKGFSADVKPGQKIALVGPTGAGKTTMVKLLMRFYDVNSGGIFVDGNNIKDFTREDLRSIFGMVLQDTWLYNGSIMDNIRYGKPHAKDEEVIESSRIAYVDHFVHTLPNGYDHVLNEETSNISQGQKQLITIARAILADPRILILDEATSSVDTRTELLIQNAMDNIMKDRTSFIIAHRLSTIRNADLILVMDNGDIVEQGNHNRLLEKKGFYANLYYSQFENGNYLSQD